MLKKHIVRTNNLNRGAFFTALGGTLVEVTSKYPNNVFVIETNPIVMWWEKHIGVVPYKKYCNQRIRLKEHARRVSGLPEHFTGQDKGFELGDIARVLPWRGK